VFEQVPLVHESLVQSIWSLQSFALQHAPHAPVAGQQLVPAMLPAQCGAFWHLPATHLSSVQRSLSLHCESSQHSAQPTPGQHSEPAPQSVAV
jgi:hypothetical protein